jgi:DNA-binding response OmpR family regulator
MGHRPPRPPPPPRSRDHAADAPPAGPARVTVLVVEDELLVRSVVERVLLRAGYHVLSAAGCAEARDRWASRAAGLGDIAVVVSDVTMPDEDGPSLVRFLRSERPGLPVLFMSGFVGGNGALTEADLSGPTDFLEKPFDADGLVDRLQALLARTHDAPGAGDVPPLTSPR